MLVSHLFMIRPVSSRSKHKPVLSCFINKPWKKNESPREILVLTTKMNSEDSYEHVHMPSLIQAFPAFIPKIIEVDDSLEKKSDS